MSFLWVWIIISVVLSIIITIYQAKTNPAPTYRNGYEYEQFAAWWLRSHGYRDVRVTKASGDFGADILCRDSRGNLVAVQCKMYKGSVGYKAVQEAVAGMQYYRAQRAMVITTGTFTAQASNAARRMGVELNANVR